jgi:hypothetical protein
MDGKMWAAKAVAIVVVSSWWVGNVRGEAPNDSLPTVFIQVGAAHAFLAGPYTYTNDGTVGFSATAGVRVVPKTFVVARYYFDYLAKDFPEQAHHGFNANNYDVGIRYFASNGNYQPDDFRVRIFVEGMLGYTSLERPTNEPLGPSRAGPNIRVGAGVNVNVVPHVSIGVGIGLLVGDPGTTFIDDGFYMFDIGLLAQAHI